MKTAVLVFFLFFIVRPAFGFVPTFPAYGTNDLAMMRMAADLNATKQNCYDLRGRLERMGHEVDRLETGFVVLSIVIGSAGASVCLLAWRDAINKKRLASEKHFAQPGADSVTVQSRG